MFQNLFRKAVKGAPVQTGAVFGGATPFSNQLGPSNSIGPVQPVVGQFGIPSSTYQQPTSAPPTPAAGFKGIAPDTAIVPKSPRTVPLFSPAPSYDPNQAL